MRTSEAIRRQQGRPAVLAALALLVALCLVGARPALTAASGPVTAAGAALAHTDQVVGGGLAHIAAAAPQPRLFTDVALPVVALLLLALAAVGLTLLATRRPRPVAVPRIGSRAPPVPVR